MGNIIKNHLKTDGKSGLKNEKIWLEKIILKR